MAFGMTLGAALLLAAANGANDNFKGVATLWGSGTLGYRGALAWASVTVFAGCMLSLFIGTGLAARFSGRGLVDSALVSDPSFLSAVAIGAFITVLAASRLGLPVSTTHALIGGLIGGGVAAHGFSGVRLAPLGRSFVLPLLLSPLLASMAAGLIYRPLRSWRRRSGLNKESCICLEPVTRGGAAPSMASESAHCVSAGALWMPSDKPVGLRAAICETAASQGVAGIRILSAMESLHLLSAGAVGVARGLNDAPKLAALLSLAPALAGAPGLLFISLTMLIGGVLGSRRVASTLSFDIAPLNEGQALVGSLVTAGLVGAASFAALPVSTTHVSCGSLFGIGASGRTAHWGMIRSIALAWIVTLPMAALSSAVCYRLLTLVR